MDTQQVMKLLERQFSVEEIKWKPAATNKAKDKAMAVAYVDARTVETRLDNVFGWDGWQDDYTILPDGNVMCRLQIRTHDGWITKSDVGSLSDQDDEGDKIKAGFSDALKRAAVKLGIGRYLYRLPRQWVPYDPDRKMLLQTPTLPHWALPPKENGTAKPADTGISAEQWKVLQAACQANGHNPADILKHFRVGRPREIRADQFNEAMALVLYKAVVLPAAQPKEPPPTQEQEDAIGQLLDELKLPMEESDKLLAKVGVANWTSLTQSQADTILNELKRLRDQKGHI